MLLKNALWIFSSQTIVLFYIIQFSNYEGFDMRFNDSVAWNTSGQYSTDLFTKRAVDIISGHNQAQPLFLYLAHLAPHAGNYDDPLQAPQHSVDKFRHISRGERRIYAGTYIYLCR